MDAKSFEDYIPRKDRERRGKREKEGRVMANGSYHAYDRDSIELFRAYKSVVRGIRYGLDMVIGFGYTSVSSICNVFRSYEPFASDKITDMSRGSISFSGGGYNCAYHLGVLKYIFECGAKTKNNPTDMFKNTTYLGASGGAGIAAIALAYYDDPNNLVVLDRILADLIEMGSRVTALSDQVEAYAQILLKYIDRDRFNRLIKRSPKLCISLTDLSNYIPSNHIESKFETLEYLIEIIRASSSVPVLLDDKVRKIGGRTFVDGGLTNNMPALCNQTIRISCLNYPSLRAEVHPSNYTDMAQCFLYPGAEAIHSMMLEGYTNFSDYMTPYIIATHKRDVENQIRQIEEDFLNDC